MEALFYLVGLADCGLLHSLLPLQITDSVKKEMHSVIVGGQYSVHSLFIHFQNNIRESLLTTNVTVEVISSVLTTLCYWMIDSHDELGASVSAGVKVAVEEEDTIL